MGTITFESRLESVEHELKRIFDKIDLLPKDIKNKVEDVLMSLSKSHLDINNWKKLLNARNTMRTIIDKFSNKSDPISNEYDINGIKVPLDTMRTFCISSFLATTWALSDCISEFVSHFCLPIELANNPKKSGKLLCIISDKNTTAKIFFKNYQLMYGWPISFSYAVRNHFIHEGAFYNDNSIFYDSTSRNIFYVNNEAWKYLEKKAMDKGIDKNNTIAPETWPINDLIMALDICNREMDNALGTLLVQSCAYLKTHVACLAGEI